MRHLARKLGIDLGRVRGSGPGGRILDRRPDRRTSAAAGRPRHAAGAPAPKLDYGKPGTRIKLAGLRRKIAEHMVQAKQTIPHYSYVDECDVTELVRLRDVAARSRSQRTA